MGSYNMPHHPVYSNGSPLAKLSTYAAIGALGWYIIKTVKKQLWN
jgi:hypothetical protein